MAVRVSPGIRVSAGVSGYLQIETVPPMTFPNVYEVAVVPVTIRTAPEVGLRLGFRLGLGRGLRLGLALPVAPCAAESTVWTMPPRGNVNTKFLTLLLTLTLT